jgi:membrane-associated phospholipid phosphatase
MSIHTVDNIALQPEKISPLLKWPAVLLSYIFHPVFIPLYASLFLVYVHPAYFSGFSNATKFKTILIVTQNAVFYPLFSIALLKGVGFIDSIFLRTQKDRIIPYIACGIFFFWTFLLFKQQAAYPRIMSSFFLGVFLSSSAALIANIYFKISLHAIALGGWLGLFLVIARSNTMLMTWPLAAVILISGIICTARLVLGHHTGKDVYGGLFLGLLMQFVAAYVML